MNWRHRLPLRYLLPFLIGSFAVVTSGLAYLNTRPDVVDNVVRDATGRMTATLTESQGALERLWRSGDLNGVKSYVATFGAERGQRATVLVGGDGTILASTSLRNIGQAAVSSYPAIDPMHLEHINTTGGAIVSVSADKSSIEGYARVCGPTSANLRSRKCGYLYYDKSLVDLTAAAIGLLRTQTIKSVLAIVIVTLLFLALLYVVLSQRAHRLVSAARAFARGDLDIRTRLEGRDELAEVGRAFDSMLDAVVEDQAALRLRDKAIAGSSNGIVIVDAAMPDQPIIYCNPAFERITAYSRDEVLGRNCRFLQNNDRDQPEIQALSNAITTGRPCNVTLRNYRKDGTMFWNDLSVAPVTTKEGCVTHFIGIQNDITKRKRAEDALRESHELLEQRVIDRTTDLEAARREAEHANAGKSRFLAAASHDLRQPLQSLDLYLSMMTRQLDYSELVAESKLKEIGGKMRKSLDTMSELLNALLDISKLDGGTVTPNKRDFNLLELLDRIVANNMQQAEEKGLQVECAGDDYVVHSDPALLERVVENFVTNAIRHTDSGRITIDCQLVDGVVRIAVSDTGNGIPTNELDKVFDEYYQLDNQARDRRKGLGLGLSIVKHLGDLLDHPLDVTSALGKGSTFSVEVPHGTTEVVCVDGQTSAKAPRSGREPVVLFVDDDPAIVDATTMLLSVSGFQVHSALNGEEALAHIANGIRPDVLVSDFRLPGYNGVEVIRRVRQATVDDLPTVLMTGDTSTKEVEAANLINCIVLRKPVTSGNFISLIENITA